MRRGNGGSGPRCSLLLFDGDLRGTVPSLHAGAVVCRARSSWGAKVSRGKQMWRVEKTEGWAASMQVFVVGDTCRRVSLDWRGSKERRRVAGVVGE